MELRELHHKIASAEAVKEELSTLATSVNATTASLQNQLAASTAQLHANFVAVHAQAATLETRVGSLETELKTVTDQLEALKEFVILEPRAGRQRPMPRRPKTEH